MRLRHYHGLNNPSAALALDEQSVIVADDEFNTLKHLCGDGASDSDGFRSLSLTL